MAAALQAAAARCRICRNDGIMVQVGMVSPADKKMGSGGSLLGSSFGIRLQSPPPLSYHNEVATLYINDFKSA